MNNEKIPTLADLLPSGDIGDLFKSQIADIKSLNSEIEQVRVYLLDNYGPIGRVNKFLTGNESTVQMVRIVLEKQGLEIWDAAQKRLKHEYAKYPDVFSFMIHDKTTPDKAAYFASLGYDIEKLK